MPDDDIPEVRPIDDDQPRRRRYDHREIWPQTNGMATAALVLGILSLFFACLTGIPAAVCGGIGLSRAGTRGVGRGPAVAGLVLGLVISFIVTPICIGLVLPAVQKAREAEALRLSQLQVKQIGLSAWNFESSFGKYPHDIVDGDPNARGRGWDPDKPLPRLTASWRVSVLPYLEQDDIYKIFDLKQPWDSPANAAASNIAVPNFLLANDPVTPNTRVRRFFGAGTLHDPSGPVKSTDITDGTSNTIFAAEFMNPVRWAEPNDYRYDVTWGNVRNPPALPPLGPGPNAVTAIVLMADGSTRVINPKKMSPGLFRALVGRNDADAIDGAVFER